MEHPRDGKINSGDRRRGVQGTRDKDEAMMLCEWMRSLLCTAVSCVSRAIILCNSLLLLIIIILLHLLFPSSLSHSSTVYSLLTRSEPTNRDYEIMLSARCTRSANFHIHRRICWRSVSAVIYTCTPECSAPRRHAHSYIRCQFHARRRRRQWRLVRI